MCKIKKGDIVGRKSYGKDILFVVERIIKKSNGEKLAILKGVTIRIEADSPINDLVIIEKQRIDNNLRSLNDRLENRIKRYTGNKEEYKKESKFLARKFLGRNNEIEVPGLILHLDGDSHLSNLKRKNIL